jgi:hypothetical protein
MGAFSAGLRVDTLTDTLTDTVRRQNANHGMSQGFFAQLPEKHHPSGSQNPLRTVTSRHSGRLRALKTLTLAGKLVGLADET